VDKRSLLLYLSGLVAAGAVAGLAASCSDQPRIKCTAQHGPFSVVYNGGSDCLDNVLGSIRYGEAIGVEAYNDPLPDNSNLDPNHGTLAMAPTALYGEIPNHPEDKAHKAYAIGKWLTSEPAGDNFCTVDSPSDGEQDLAYVPAEAYPDGGGKPAVPALNMKYHWTNVRFYDTPALPGNQLDSDLTLAATVGQEDGGAGAPCTAQIHAVGLWPSVDCTADPLPDGGAPPSPLDETKCSPVADNAKGRPTGSGISPDLKTRCDEHLHLCVLQSEPR